MRLRSIGYGPNKPGLGASIVQGHPLADGLIACFLCNELGGPIVDLVTGNTVPLTASAARGNFVFGHGLDCSAANDTGARATAWSLLKTIGEQVTILWRGSVGASPSAFAGLFGVSHSGGSPFSCFQFDLGSTGALIRMVWNSGGVQNNLSATPTTANDGTERQYVGIVRGQSGLCSLWENTVRKASSNANFGPTYNAASGIEIGTLRSGAGVNSKSKFRHGMIWNRALRDREVQQLYFEPYAFIERCPVNVLIPAAAPTPSQANPYYWLMAGRGNL